MATPVQAVNEPEYGAKITQAQNQDDYAAAQAPQPAIQWPEMMAEGDVVQQSPVVPNAQQGDSFMVKNPYMLLPAGLNFPQQRKTPVERSYDLGLLWEVLANDTQASELTRMVARGLMRQGD